MRRWEIMLLIIVLLFAGCGSRGERDGSQISDTPTPTGVTMELTPAASPTTTARTITRVGTALEATDAFALDAGPARVIYRYVGPVDAALDVRLTDALTGTAVADIANLPTPGLGETVVMIPSPGTFTLDVQLVEGVWQIDIQQPVPGQP